ncbi:MAG: hypothetical protein ABI551_18080 [Polyangiaceae bacterium]
MGRLSLSSLMLALVFLSSTAHAEDPNLPTVEEHRVWYGWQPLTCDALAFTAFYVAAKTAPGEGSVYFLDPTWAGVGATLFYTCGPAVHLAHGHAIRMLADLGLRTVMTAPTLLVFGGAASNEHGYDPYLDRQLDLAFGALFAVGGAAAVVAIDATIMSRETIYVVVPKSQPTFKVAPDIETRRGGGTLGLRGTF